VDGVIGIVVTALLARRGQALALAVLSLFAVAAAVAVPAYQHAVDNAVVAAEVAAAPPGGRSLSLTASVDEREAGPSDDAPDLANIGAAIVQVPGFTQVTGQDFPVVGLEPGPQDTTAVVFRQDACAHLTIVDGRCLIAQNEVVVGERTAQRLGKGPGDLVPLTYARVTSTPSGAITVVPDGIAKILEVVGVYRVSDPADQFWGNHGFFDPDREGQRGEPLFTNAPTLAAMDHGTTNETIDATVDPAALRPDRLDTIGAQVGDVLRRTNGINDVNVSSGIPDLLGQIATGRRLARQVVPVIAVPLVLLALFVIFLVVGYGTEARRPELAALRLRGTRWWLRWWVAAGETVLPVVAGAILGFLVGQLAIAAIATVRFGATTVSFFDLSFIWYGLSAALGAVLVTLLAQRRTLATPVVDLLRSVPVTVARWRLLAGEIVVVVLTAVVLAQLWLFDKSLLGVGLFAPALVIFALGLLISHLLPPIAARVGSRALRRGRLGPALAAFQLARRPGVQRIFLLLSAAVALLAFAASAVDVAARDRSVAATVGTGAPRVLTVDHVTRSQLLQAIRAVDPDGRFAMAVAEVPPGRPGEAPKLAVDSSRLAHATVWPDGSLSAARAAELLHPPSNAPVIFPSEDIAVDVTVAGANPSAPVNLVVVVSSVTGKGTATVPLGALNNGPYTYQQSVPECAGGCRLAGLHAVTGGISSNSFAIRVTLRGLRSTSPNREALAPAELAETRRWRTTNATVSAVTGGLLADFTARDGNLGSWLQPADAPYPLPVVSTASAPSLTEIAGLDGKPIPVSPVGRVSALPRLGTAGTLIDLEYADRISTDAGPARNPQVWLGPAAPADVLSRLGDQGLVVTGDRTVAATHHQLDRQGAALALPFHPFAAALAVLLAAGSLILVAAVDRRRRADDFEALRVQGLGRAAVGQAVLWAYPLLVATAAVVGLVIGLAAWFAAGWAVPVLDTGQDALPLPVVPRPLPVLGAWLAAGLVLTGISRLAGRRSSSL
jgi:putative ABC transport system permease protein